MFNLFLNNQSFMGFLLGTIATSPDKRIRVAAILTMAVDLALNVMHGEQFMAVLHIGLCSLAPFISIHAMNGKPVVRYLGIGAGLALLLGAVSIVYSYRGRGLKWPICSLRASCCRASRGTWSTTMPSCSRHPGSVARIPSGVS